MTKYDSRPDTLKHIEEVQKWMWRAGGNLVQRLRDHDASKLVSPEVEVFDEFTPKLKDCVFDSDEYKGFLVAMKPALDHHYANNPHHPEYHANGIKDMSLLDIIEMLCDWKASTLRTKDGDLLKSIEINQKRFGYTHELKDILVNTAKELKMI